MIRKNGLFSISIFLILFLCSCTKRGGSNLSGKVHGLNDEFTATDKNNYITPNILGNYGLKNEEMDKIGARARKEVALKFENENNLKGNGILLNDSDVKELAKIAKYDADIQKYYDLSNKQMIQIEREDRRNTYSKTRPANNKVYNSEFPTYNNSFPKNY